MAGFLFLSDDLMFGSRVSHAAQQQAVKFKHLMDPAPLAQSLEMDGLKMLILDLSSSRFCPDEVMQSVRDAGLQIKTMAFGPHVQTGKLAKAEQAGFEQVLSNSQFVERLPQLFSDPADE